MSAALELSERLCGYVAFGESVPEVGYERGKDDRTRVELRLKIIIDDVDCFIAGPGRCAMLRGSLVFDELGGIFSIDLGEVRILPTGADARQGWIYYRAGVLMKSGTWFTVHGLKQLHGGRGRTSFRDAFAVRTVLVHEHGKPKFDIASDATDWAKIVTEPDASKTIAAGILRMNGPGLAAMLTSFRPQARTRVAGAVTVARFCAAVAGRFADVYLPPALNAGRPSPYDAAGNPPHLDAFVPSGDGAGATAAAPDAPPPSSTAEDSAPATPRVGPPGGPSLRPIKSARWADIKLDTRCVIDIEERDPLVDLQHVLAKGAAADKGPVLLLAGSSVNGSVFHPVGVEKTIVDRLLEEGYDVWIENWRGSLGHTSREYSLDEAAAYDHPAAVAAVARATGERKIKAVVHCLGSSAFMLALAAGRLHTKDFEVTHVVSNAVSLHPMVPPAAEVKIRAFAPVMNRVIPYMDPQWARDKPLTDEPIGPPADASDAFPKMTHRTRLGGLLVGWVRLTHHECDNGVSNFAQFMYGAGPSTLYDESRLSYETAKWMERQFAWAPARLYRQLSRSLMAGHLVPMREWPPDKLPPNLFENGPDARVKTKITFMTGTRNKTFSPTSQRKTYEWFCAHHGNGRHTFAPLEGFGHLDVWLAKEQSKVHDVVLKGLARR